LLKAPRNDPLGANVNYNVLLVVNGREEITMSKRIMQVILTNILILILIAIVTDGNCQEWKLTGQQLYSPKTRHTPRAWSFADDIEKETGGRVKFIKRFDAASLIPATRALPALAEGTLHLFLTAPLFHSGVDPVFVFTEIPGLATTRELKEKIIQDDEIMRIVQKAWNRQGIQLIGYSCVSQQVWSFRKKLKSIDDMKGLQIAGSGGPYADLVTAVGAVTVLTPPVERYEAMMRGVADGVASTIDMLEDQKFGETVIQIMLPPWHVYQMNPWLASKKLWDSFPEDIKAIINRVARIHLKKTGDAYDEDIAKGDDIRIIKKYNLDRLQLSKDDLIKLHKAYDVVIDKYATISTETKKLVDIWRAKYRH